MSSYNLYLDELMEIHGPQKGCRRYSPRTPKNVRLDCIFNCWCCDEPILKYHRSLKKSKSHREKFIQKTKNFIAENKLDEL
jgi:hypothetical protein